MIQHEEAISANNDWIQTHLGQKFHFWSHDPTEVHIEDVARGLAQTCRWRGMYKAEIEFYSVAQHCVIASKMVPQYAKKFALMHDAGEWPVGDMPKPIKGGLPDYKKLEGFLLSKICNRFKVPLSERVIKAVKTVDNWLLWEEGEQLLPNPALLKEWHIARLDNPWAPARFKIRPWMPREAEKQFLQQYKDVWNV